MYTAVYFVRVQVKDWSFVLYPSRLLNKVQYCLENENSRPGRDVWCVHIISCAPLYLKILDPPPVSYINFVDKMVDKNCLNFNDVNQFK